MWRVVETRSDETSSQSCNLVLRLDGGVDSLWCCYIVSESLGVASADKRVSIVHSDVDFCA